MNPLRAWNAFWFGPISARPLGAFRIAFGVVALANLALLTADFDHWFTDAGLLHGTEAREAAGPLRLSPLQWVQDPTSVRVAFAATAVVAVLFTLGWRTRMMGVVLYLGMLSIHHRNVSTASGADVLLMVLAFYLMLSPCGAAYSLDARRASRKRGTLAEPLIVPWAQRLIQLQVGLVYFNTAVLKADGTTWLDGTALHFVLNNSEVGRFSLDPLTQYPLAINALTLGGLVIEFALAFLLWFRATRPWAILAGMGLHAGILLTVNIPIFGELMIATYLTFLAPDELDALLRRLDPRNWLDRRQSRRPAIPGRVDGPSRPQGLHQLRWEWQEGPARIVRTSLESGPARPVRGTIGRVAAKGPHGIHGRHLSAATRVQAYSRLLRCGQDLGLPRVPDRKVRDDGPTLWDSRGAREFADKLRSTRREGWRVGASPSEGPFGPVLIQLANGDPKGWRSPYTP